MVGFVSQFVVAGVLIVLVLRRGGEGPANGVPGVRRLRLAALVPLALQGGVFALFGVGEMAGGDLSGAVHFLQLALVLLLGLLAWWRPVEGGAGLFLVGLVTAASLAGADLRGAVGRVAPALIILALPCVLSGALFLAAGLRARRIVRLAPLPSAPEPPPPDAR